MLQIIRKRLVVGTVLAMSIALATPHLVSASPITVANFSFESGDAGDGAGAELTDWTVAGFQFPDHDWTNAEFAGTDGDNVQGVLPDGGQTGFSTVYYLGTAYTSNITQTVGTVAANTQYTLTVAIGTRLDTPSGGWTIELLAGGTTIASDTANSGPAAGTFFDHLAIAGPFVPSNPNVGQNLTIRITAFNPTGNTTVLQDQFDNVRLDATLVEVPEPGTAGLLCLGAMFTLLRRRAL